MNIDGLRDLVVGNPMLLLFLALGNGCTGAYAFANVLLTETGALIILL